MISTEGERKEELLEETCLVGFGESRRTSRKTETKRKHGVSPGWVGDLWYAVSEPRQLYMDREGRISLGSQVIWSGESCPELGIIIIGAMIGRK